MTLEAHNDYAGMYYVVWPDGVKSADFYNYTRAFNHMQVIMETEKRNQYRDAVQSFLEAHTAI